MKNVFLAGMLVLSFIGVAQLPMTNKAKLTEYSESAEKIKYTDRPKLLGQIGTDLFAVNFGKRDISIIKYNKKYQKVNTVVFDSKYQDEKLDSHYPLIVGDELLIIGDYYSKEESKTKMVIMSLNTNLGVKKDFKVVAEIESGEKKLFGKNRGSFDIVLSEDEQSFAIQVNKPYDKDEEEYFKFKVYDNELELQWEEEFNIPIEDRYFSLDDVYLSSDMSVYLVGVAYKSGAERRASRREGEATYSHYLVKVDDGDVYHKSVELDGQFITDLKFGFGKNNQIICSGFYSDKGTYSIKGAYFMSLDEDFDVVKSSTIPFTFDLMVENYSDKQKKKAEKKKDKGKAKDMEMYEYDLDDVIIREDGSAVMIAEQYYVRVTVTTSTDANGNTTTRTTYHYYYNDLLVINISPNGEIEWARKIPKRQYSTNDGGYYSSYGVIETDNNIYFVYTDNIKNFDGTAKKGRTYYYTTRQKEQVLVLVTMKGTGNYEKEILKIGSRKDGYYRLKSAIEVGDKALVFPKYDKKKMTLTKVELK